MTVLFVINVTYTILTMNGTKSPILR